MDYFLYGVMGEKLRFRCYFEVLWVRCGVVRVEWFGVKFGRFGEILSND